MRKSQQQKHPYPDIIATKLHPPQLRTGVVHRRRLLDKLNVAPSKLVLVAAPAGFGKTTFVIDWLNKKEENFAWLSLDESDNDMQRFLIYFLSSLQTVEKNIGEKLVAGLKGTSVPAAETILTHLLNELLLYAKPVTIVFDDYYFIREREIHRAVAFFLDHLPPNVRVIISTRIDPLLPLHRLRARGELNEIRERDLRFTVNEAVEFFESTMQISLTQDDVEKLAGRTEGWIAGLQLAAVSLYETRDVKKFIDSFTGSNRYILDYLLEEVLNSQSREVQMFLLQTSILSRFNEELCNTITAGMNAKKILDYLERSNLFLIPLDDQREWFRYHHLFSELLQHRLRQLYPGLIEELHNNASIWFEEQQNIDEAINYALRGKNFERAAFLLDRYGVLFLSRSELSTLINLDQKIPAEITAKYSSLLVIKAWAQMLMHKTVDIEKTLKAAEYLIESDENDSTPDDIIYAKGHIATIRAFILRLRGELRQSLDMSLAVLEAIPPEQFQIRGLLQFNIGRIYMKQGYAHKAITIFENAFDDNFRAGNYYVSLAMLGHTGYLYSITRSLAVARIKLEEALRFARENEIDSLPAAGYIYYQLGRVLYHLNELDDARNILERAIELGELGDEPDIVCNALFLLTVINSLCGQHEQALGTFLKAENLVNNSTIPVYEADIEIERIALALFNGEYDKVENWVKTAIAAISGEYTVIDESRCLAMMRYYLLSEKFDDVIAVAQTLRKYVTERQRNHILIQIDIMEGIARWHLSDKNNALTGLRNGIEKASEMGYKRILLNIGKQLGDIVPQLLKEKIVSERAEKFIGELFSDISLKTVSRYRPKPGFKQKLIEPLTDREQEVLYYISQDYSNKEIAKKLFVSLDTVKTHLKNLYGKLDVNSRQDAVKKAREMEVLTN